MIKDELLAKFNKQVNNKNILESKKVLTEELISKFEVKSDDTLLYIDSKVLSDDYISEFKCNLEFDIKDKYIFSTFCSCSDFEKNEFKKDNYCCKHIIASFYNFVHNIDKYPLIKDKFSNDKINKAIFKLSNNNLLDSLIDNTIKDEIKIEVFISRIGIKNKLTAEFKIGLKGLSSNKLYVIKDINQLLISFYNGLPIKYGKDYTFDLKTQKFGAKENRIINFIEKIRRIEGVQSNFLKRQDKFIDGKNLIIPEFLIRDFFEAISESRVYLNEGFFYRPIETEIIFDKPDIKFSLKELSSEFILSVNDGFFDILDKDNSVFLYGTSIYLPNFNYCIEIQKFLNAFNKETAISFNKNEEMKVLSKLLPKLYTLSNMVSINKKIKDKVVKEDVKFNFYFDKVNKDVTLTLKVKYGEHEFNIFSEYKNKIIYRDLNKEEEIKSYLRSLGFESSFDKFYLLLGDDYLFKFFKEDIIKLHDRGEVFYSENFKIIKSIGKKNIHANLERGKHNYFEFTFEIDEIPKEEFKNILLAFKDNLKYYKLNSGEFLDLEEIEIKNFLKLVDVLSLEDDLNFDKITFGKAKGLYLSNFIKENKIRYISGKEELNQIQKKFNEIKKLSFKEPLHLNAELRPYQKEGYNWLKTMEYLGFGGILGDEMGLGKTLQAITFILSNLPKKTFIIAPTSLIYNWSNEIEKFAPSVKFVVLNGSKDEREKILKNISEYDVFITTYNLLKMDIDIYKDLSFDYLFIDEAQYIKNSSSQNALSVKQIKANTRFALTGTPVENSLMELWSIFDFIMPGYLFDEKRFSVRYHKKLHESNEVLEELNKLIKPFILRRYKKDVIKELPKKIEKKLIVSMDKEQEKVYKTYSDYAKALIEKKIQNEEFKTSKIEILSYITKLRQICLDPSVLMNDYIGRSGKIDALIEILHQGIEEGHKILVFSQFTSILKNISNRLNLENISFAYLDGSISSEKRINLINEFNNGDTSVFLISLKAGGTGLNLTSADIVIHFDPWWNPAVEDQATDRAHRFGQKNIVEVIKLISKNTIEEKIVELQDEKRKLIEKIIDNSEDFVNINSLNEDDILNLFSMK